jgi:release factor glutamine methyltransferase
MRPEVAGMGDARPGTLTVGELQDELAVVIAGPDAPPARSLARDIIAGVMGEARFWPSAHRDDALTDALAGRMRAAATKLREGQPIQYAVGRAQYRHLTLAVDRRVLIPRSETELIVDLVLAAQRGGKGTVVDVGTGSGAIALALASEGAFERVIATDLSPDALDVARANLVAIPEDRRTRVSFRHGNLLEPLAGEKVEAVVSNPPYISPDEAAGLPRLVRDWEPHSALFAEAGGMAVIAALVPGAAEVLLPGGLLALEVDSGRAALAAQLVSNDGRFTDVETRLDLTGRPRFVVARRKEQ